MSPSCLPSSHHLRPTECCPVTGLAVDRFEQAFDHGLVSAATVIEQVESLRARVHRVKGPAEQRDRRVLPALAPLFPTGALRAGVAYGVTGSTTLAMALLAAASTDGDWCGVVGVPELGVEAAAQLGVALDRVVLVPAPGRRWVTVVAAMADVLGMVVVRPPIPAYDAEAARLSARLRQHGGTLVALGPWPQCEARLEVVDSTWVGVGAGHGHLTGRQGTVQSVGRDGRVRRARLWLPGTDARVARVLAPAATTGVA